MWFQSDLLDPIAEAFEGIVPSALRRLYSHMQAVETRVGQSLELDLSISQEDLPLIRRAALHYRHQVALQQDRLRVVNVGVEHAADIDALTAPVEADLGAGWLRNVAPLRRPSLTDYVNVKTARAILQASGRGSFPARVYDDKFGILWSPSACLDVIEAARTESWLLGTSTCVAYADIDEFKKVNSAATETVVDREVLPPFMLLLEAHTAQRGYAFRQGGDEYVVVLPNADDATARSLLEGLRALVCAQPFGGQTFTLSIGYYIAASDCTLTNGEILLRANTAKNSAKSAGKNRVCS